MNLQKKKINLKNTYHVL